MIVIPGSCAHHAGRADASCLQCGRPMCAGHFDPKTAFCSDCAQRFASGEAPLPLDRVLDDPNADPIARFGALFEAAKRVDAAKLPEPTAFTLATVGDDGQPSARVLLLKSFDAAGFVFYTNFESRKGRELAAHPKAAMVFHWQHLERQVRIEGGGARVSDAEADAYFHSRPRGSQLGAWASHQSAPLDGYGELQRRLDEYEREFAGGPVPRPAHWSGFRLVPARVEFWRLLPSRLHVRHLYTRAGADWRLEWLNP